MLLSIVIPIYNEAEVIPFLLRELQTTLARIPHAYEVIFVDDGSKDASLRMLRAASESDHRLKVLSFPRNFGHQAAITAGLDFARGDAVAVMDADLQDPPELLLDMIARYQEGYDVVSAQRIAREGDGMFKRWTAAGFYWIMRNMVDERMVPEVGDFRLFSRHALAGIRNFREQHRFMRGLVAWLGLKEAIVPFQRKSRVAGATKYPLHKMIRFAWTAIASFSALPLRLTMLAGLFFCLLGVAGLFWVIWAALFAHRVVPGWSSIVVVQLVFSGITLLSLGVIGEYVAKIYDESKQRPLYVVKECINLPQPAEPVLRAVVLREPEPAPIWKAPRA
jgi:polyisoprenyl-phosphate glycosyltransferase